MATPKPKSKKIQLWVPVDTLLDAINQCSKSITKSPITEFESLRFHLEDNMLSVQAGNFDQSQTILVPLLQPTGETLSWLLAPTVLSKLLKELKTLDGNVEMYVKPDDGKFQIRTSPKKGKKLGSLYTMAIDLELGQTLKTGSEGSSQEFYINRAEMQNIIKYVAPLAGYASDPSKPFAENIALVLEKGECFAYGTNAISAGRYICPARNETAVDTKIYLVPIVFLKRLKEAMDTLNWDDDILLSFGDVGVASVCGDRRLWARTRDGDNFPTNMIDNLIQKVSSLPDPYLVSTNESLIAFNLNQALHKQDKDLKHLTAMKIADGNLTIEASSAAWGTYFTTSIKGNYKGKVEFYFNQSLVKPIFAMFANVSLSFVDNLAGIQPKNMTNPSYVLVQMDPPKNEAQPEAEKEGVL